jgi:protein TonB
MPRELFSQTLVPGARPTRSRWTVAGSLLAHTALVAILVVVPIVSGASAPDITRRLNSFVVAMTPSLPPPPAPRPPVTRAAPVEVNPSAAPIAATEHPADLPPLPPSAGEFVPGAIPVAGTGTPPGLGSKDGPVLLPPPPPAPKPREPVRPGGAIKTPQRIAYAPPIYPQIAQVAKVEGTVILEATIDETGVVRNVTVLRSIPLLDRAAIDAVSKWRYTPTTLNGVPVPILMTVTVTFKLRSS